MLLWFCLELFHVLYKNFIILTEFMKKLMSDVEDGSDVADRDASVANSLYPLLMQHNGGSQTWNKG